MVAEATMDAIPLKVPTLILVPTHPSAPTPLSALTHPMELTLLGVALEGTPEVAILTEVSEGQSEAADSVVATPGPIPVVLEVVTPEPTLVPIPARTKELTRVATRPDPEDSGSVALPAKEVRLGVPSGVEKNPSLTEKSSTLKTNLTI